MKTNSPFVVGAACAIVNTYGWGGARYTRCEVRKVRKDGKFFVRYPNGSDSEQMWTPTGPRCLEILSKPKSKDQQC